MKHKVMIHRTRARRLGVVVFLHNCRTCLRGNEVNIMFDCDPPTLNEYIPLNVHLPRFDLDEEEDREDDVYDALEQL